MTFNIPPHERPEYILCAAIWIDDGKEHAHQPSNIATGMVFAGWRHHNCFTPLVALYGTPAQAAALADSEEQLAGRNQGFLTSKGRFVDRDEAGQIAFAAGQTDREGLCLTSEDLY